MKKILLAAVVLSLSANSLFAIHNTASLGASYGTGSVDRTTQTVKSGTANTASSTDAGQDLEFISRKHQISTPESGYGVSRAGHNTERSNPDQGAMHSGQPSNTENRFDSRGFQNPESNSTMPMATPSENYNYGPSLMD